MVEGYFLSALSLVLLFEQLRVEAVPGAVLGAVPGAVLVPDGGFGAQPLVHTNKVRMDVGCGAAFLDDSHRYWRRNGGGDGNSRRWQRHERVFRHLQVLCRGTR